jgi:hypothetical protein
MLKDGAKNFVDQDWVQLLASFDFATAGVSLVASVPSLRRQLKPLYGLFCCACACGAFTRLFCWQSPAVSDACTPRSLVW